MPDVTPWPETTCPTEMVPVVMLMTVSVVALMVPLNVAPVLPVKDAPLERAVFAARVWLALTVYVAPE